MSTLKEIAADRESEAAPPGHPAGLVFTRFLRGLERGRPREDESFEEVWQALRGLLAGELRRRSLWALPPTCLGIYGSASWTDREALDELAADAFLFVFGDRLRSLEAHLRFLPNVEGLVLRSVRNFLHETQKRHDPVGFRVFTVLRAAVRAMVAAGTLSVVAGSPAVRRDTILGFRPESSPAAPVLAGDLAPCVRLWSDDLLPELILARGWEVPPLLAKIEGHLGRLPAQGVAVFRFQDLVDPLRLEIRKRWRALWAEARESGAVDLAEEGPWIAPISLLEEREGLASLIRCLERGIDSLPERSRTQGYLRRLQLFLVSYAVDGSGLGGGAAEKLPSQRRLADLLRIPRERVPGLFATLRKLAEACRQRGEAR
jgi:hypothetical protein